MKKDTNTNDKKSKKNKKKKRSIIGTFFKILLILILVIILGIAGWIGINYFRHRGGGDYDPLSAAALGVDPEKMKNVGRINVLVLGESGVGDGYKLTDSIMLVSYNPKTQQASILSIPRDTYVGKRDKNSASQQYLMSYKMNAVYRNGQNIPETVERVSDVTGVKIDNYVLIDTDAIIEIVDAIGGVTFDVPIDMDYDDPTQGLHIHLKAGEQLIDGPKAEQLLRFRHNNNGTSYPKEYGDNDLGRMRTQREFIQETLKQLVKFENVTKVINLVDIVFKNIKTDLTLETIKCYIPYAFRFDMNNIQTDTVPGKPEQVNGIWIYTANKKETDKVVEKLFTDIAPEDQVTNTIEGTEVTNTSNNEKANTEKNNTTKNETTKNETEKNNTTKNNSKITIEILNGSGSDSKLEKAKAQLEKDGYTVSKTGNTSVTSTSIIINRTMQGKSVIDNLKETTGIKTSNNSSNNSKVDFTIILGKDYK